MYSTSRKNPDNTYGIYFQNKKKYLTKSPSRNYSTNDSHLLSTKQNPSIIFEIKGKKNQNLTERNERVSIPISYSNNISYNNQKEFEFLKTEIKNLKKKNNRLKSDLHNEKKKNSGWSTITYGTVKTKKKNNEQKNMKLMFENFQIETNNLIFQKDNIILDLQQKNKVLKDQLKNGNKFSEIEENKSNYYKNNAKNYEVEIRLLQDLKSDLQNDYDRVNSHNSELQRKIQNFKIQLDLDKQEKNNLIYEIELIKRDLSYYKKESSKIKSIKLENEKLWDKLEILTNNFKILKTKKDHISNIIEFSENDNHSDTLFMQENYLISQENDSFRKFQNTKKTPRFDESKKKLESKKKNLKKINLKIPKPKKHSLISNSQKSNSRFQKNSNSISKQNSYLSNLQSDSDISNEETILQPEIVSSESHNIYKHQSFKKKNSSKFNLNFKIVSKDYIKPQIITSNESKIRLNSILSKNSKLGKSFNTTKSLKKNKYQSK